MEAIAGKISTEVLEPKKSGRGQYERKTRGSYQKHKLSKKITVKHFLNKRIDLRKKFLKEIGVDTEGMDSLYPIYVQVTFNRKTTTLRSATQETCRDEEELQEYLEDEEDENLGEALLRERRFIEYYLQNYYQHHLKHSLSYLEKLKNYESFEESDRDSYVNDTFDLDSAMVGFNLEDYELNKMIELALKKEIKDFARTLLINEIKEKSGNDVFAEEEEDEFKNMMKSDYFSIENLIDMENLIERPENNIGALELLSFYEMKKSEFSKLREIFPSYIWHFNVLYGIMYSKSRLYEVLPPTILDFREGDFKIKFISSFKDVKEKRTAKKIIKDIEKLIENGNLY